MFNFNFNSKETLISDLELEKIYKENEMLRLEINTLEDKLRQKELEIKKLKQQLKKGV